jgi:hypothetical protein
MAFPAKDINPHGCGRMRLLIARDCVSPAHASRLQFWPRSSM